MNTQNAVSRCSRSGPLLEEVNCAVHHPMMVVALPAVGSGGNNNWGSRLFVVKLEQEQAQARRASAASFISLRRLRSGPSCKLQFRCAQPRLVSPSRWIKRSTRFGWAARFAVWMWANRAFIHSLTHVLNGCGSVTSKTWHLADSCLQVFPVLAAAAVVVVIAAGGQAAELPNHLKEDTISKDLYEASPRIVSAASVAAARNTIVSAPPGPGGSAAASATAVDPSAKILNAVAGDSTAAVRGKESAIVVVVKDSVIATGGNPNEAVVYVQATSNNNEQHEKLVKPSEKPPPSMSTSMSSSSIPTHTEKADNNEHSVGERIEKVMPVKENTVATHAGKGGSSSSLKVAAQMVGVYQTNKR